MLKTNLIDLLNDRIPEAKGANFQWERLLAVADYSKVSALLFYKVKELQKEFSIPEGIYLKLKDTYQKNLIRNTLIRDELEKLTLSLKEENIPAILLKGGLFLYTLYKDLPGIRRLEDVDIMVKEIDREKAANILENQGYTYAENKNGAKDKPKSVNSRKAEMYLKHNIDNSVLMPVHLHWHFINLSPQLFMKEWRAIDMNDIWDCSVAVEEDKNIFMMSQEHALLAMCIHGLSHAFSRINLLFDLHSFISRYRDSLDWDRLEILSRNWGVSAALYIGIRLSCETFATAIPDGFLDELSPQGTGILEKYFLRYVKNNDFPSEDMCIILYLALNQGALNKAAFILRGLALKAGRSFS